MIKDLLQLQYLDCLTILQVSFTENEIIYKVQMDDNCEGCVDFNVFKEEMINYFRIVSGKTFFQSLEEEGISIVYLIYDINEHLRKTITVYPKEILTYYQ